MTSSRPYLIRAIHEWISDNNLTPYITVDAQIPGTEVPAQYIKDGLIVLNLSQTAVQALVLGNDWISFRARFSGKVIGVHIPINAVLAIYAKENGQGMSFAPETTASDDNSPPPSTPSPPARTGRPTLKVVK